MRLREIEGWTFDSAPFPLERAMLTAIGDAWEREIQAVEETSDLYDMEGFQRSALNVLRDAVRDEGLERFTSKGFSRSESLRYRMKTITMTD